MATPQNSPRKYYVLQDPDRLVEIHLSLDVVDKLEQEQRRLAAAKTKTEFIGVLLGHSTHEPQRVIFVQDFELPAKTKASSKKQAGAYNIAELADKWSAERQLGQYPIGFFRAQKQGWQGLNERDLETARQFFPGPDTLVLLVRLTNKEAGQDDVFSWEYGVIGARDSYVDVPFDTASLAPVEEPPNRTIYPAATPAPKLPPAPADVYLPVADVYKPPIRWLRLLPTAVLVTAGVLATQVAWDSNWGRKSSSVAAGVADTKPAPVPLALKVESGTKRLDIDWRHDSPPILGGGLGTITISDRGVTKVLMLDQQQLRDGHVTYIPSSSDVDIRLEITLPDGTMASESVRLVSTDPVLSAGQR
jgi:hypothetical protein